MKQSRTRILTECSIMIALASVLSVLKLVDMPYGGSVTPAAMLPILLFAYRHGLGWGMGCATLYGVVQSLLGMENFSYVSGPISLITLFLLDYFVAYAAVGIGGLFRRIEKHQSFALLWGAVLVSLLRYTCHVISGFTVWNEMQVPSAAAITYSLSYNLTYMLPECIILSAAALYVGGNLDLSRPVPTRMTSEKIDAQAALLRALGGLSALLSVVWAVREMAPFWQAESGEFFLLGLAAVNWGLLLGVSLPLVAVALLLFILAHMRGKKNNI